MSKEKFLLVSLKEEQAKKLANAISSDSCRSILNFLADKDSTESEISNSLSQPISTVHYNLQLLMKAGLVKVEEYHYSPKGREVNHYKLANQYIIIAPEPRPGFDLRQRLKSLLPACLVALLGSFIIQLYSSLSRGAIFAEKAMTQMQAPLAASARSAAASAAPAAKDAANAVVSEAASQSAPIAASYAHAGSFPASPAVWFLLGCIFAIGIVLLIEFVISKWRDRK